MSRCHLILPDVQAKPGLDFSHLHWAGSFAVDKKPDVIVCIGDFADMPSLSLYDVGKKSFEGRKYSEDIAAANTAMEVLMRPITIEQQRLIRNKEKQWNPRLVMTLGNHEARINRAIDLDRKLEGLMSIDDLRYSDNGWEVYPYLVPVIVDGIAYSHYFVSGILGRPITSARALLTKKHMSCVAGHQQGKDIAYSRRADGKNIIGLIAGSFYRHDEDYLGPQGNVHWRGLVVLHEVNEGECDDMFVSMNYLEKKYG